MKIINTGIVGATVLAASLFTALMIVATVASAGQDKQVEVIVYPILIQAPIFGASIDLPSVPSVPGSSTTTTPVPTLPLATSHRPPACKQPSWDQHLGERKPRARRRRP